MPFDLRGFLMQRLAKPAPKPGQTPLMLGPGHPGELPAGEGVAGEHRGPGGAAQAYLTHRLGPEQYAAEGRAGVASGNYDAALADPNGEANIFRDYFKSAADANSAQANRDFSSTLARTGANVASRFGGNASSEESRQDYNTSDLFSRNLTEGLAKLGPEAAQMGMEHTGMLGEAQQGAVNERDRLSQLMLQGMGMYAPKKQKSKLGGLIGTGLGALLAIPTGGMSVAAGAALGGQIGNGTGV